MPSNQTPDDELLRQFRQRLSEMSSEEIHGILNGLLDASGRAVRRPERPDLRHPPREEPALFTLRVDLEHASPPIWRRLELRSDLMLEEVHGILQTAFGWFDAHLWRFAAGGHPFDLESQLFLCPFDVEEGEDEGLPASQVRLDEVLSASGDRLGYVYDYGDDWQLRLLLESVRRQGMGPRPPAPSADGVLPRPRTAAVSLARRISPACSRIRRISTSPSSSAPSSSLISTPPRTEPLPC